MSLATRTLGPDLTVAEIGLGCMGMSAFYGARDDEAESVATLAQAIEQGVTLIDTADMYGNGENERLVGRTLRDIGARDRIVLATKFANTWDPATGARGPVRGDPAYVRAACDASLQRLGLDHIDLYYQHRVDPNVPIEDTVGAMADLVRAGKVRALGLSEAGPDTIRRAHRTHPIAALQTEYSLWSREPEDGLLALCRELGIGFVPYSPLGRGFLTGEITRVEDLAPDDVRRSHPRFQGENFDRNLALVAEVRSASPRPAAAPPPSSPSPGCWPRAPTSCRSPAPSAASISPTIWAPPRSPSPLTSWPRSTASSRRRPSWAHATTTRGCAPSTSERARRGL